MATDPIFFQPTRVWRCYLGGKLLDRFVGAGEGKDDYFPEDWLASVTRALNGAHSQGPDEGLARTLKPDGSAGELFADLLAKQPEALLGAAHVAKFGSSTAVLCKYLDSAVRLPIQCHPDRDYARRFYNSSFGKAESWTILDTRVIDGQEPCLLMGFKPGVSAEAFARTVREQDVPAMVGMLNRIPAEVGKTYMVPGRMPHAIGAGVFMLEVQEPSDWVIQTETRCADTVLTEQDMYGPLTPEQSLEVFDYTGYTLEEQIERVYCPPEPVQKTPGGTLSEVIGPKQTDAFSICRAELTGEMTVELPRPFAVAVVADGAGTMDWGAGRRAIRRGAYFFLPASLEPVRYEADGKLSLLLALPPEA